MAAADKTPDEPADLVAPENFAPEKVPAQHWWRRLPGWFDLVLTIVVVLVIFEGVQLFLFKPFVIPSGSMIPTLQINQRIIVNRIAGRWGSPHLGQVVVFHPPTGADSGTCGVSHAVHQACAQPTSQQLSIYFVKRIVGIGGDHLYIKDGQVYRNGILESGSYINRSADLPPGERASDCQICNLPEQITVPKGDYFMMGDNRGNSDDSRVWGPVPRSAIIGPVVATYWPLDRIGIS